MVLIGGKRNFVLVKGRVRIDVELGIGFWLVRFLLDRIDILSYIKIS